MTNPSTPIDTVDLSSSLPSVRDQGQRALCLAFAASDTNSHANGILDALSVEYLAHFAYIACGHSNFNLGLPISAVKHALHHTGQPLESSFPYDMTGHTPKTPMGTLTGLYKAHLVEQKLSFDETVQAIEHKVPVIVGLNLTMNFYSPSPPYLLDHSSSMPATHAVLIVGHGNYGPIKCLKIRNSWGPGWAHHGYAWITEAFYNHCVIATAKAA